MKTNGQRGTPSRSQIILEASYYAAVYGCYDTSEAAQLANILTITVIDAANIPGDLALPPGATHRFSVCVNDTAYFVTRYPKHYEVEPHDQDTRQRQERELREAVLDAALWHFTGKGAGYQRGRSTKEEKEGLIAKLLAQSSNGEERQREEGDPVNHAVVRDARPDPTLSLAPGPDGGPAPRVLRQWSVEIGPYHSCIVAFFGYNEDGGPELITMDQEQSDDYEEEEEEE